MTEWKSVVETDRDAVHIMPICDADPVHECTTTCWCDPVIAMLEREDTTFGLLVSHRLEDGATW